MEWQTTGPELSRLITPALSFVSRDGDVYPVLNSVQLSAVNGRVIAEATDRLRAVTMFGPPAAASEWSVMLSAATWRELLATFRRAPSLTLRATGDGRLAVHTEALDGVSGSLSYPVTDGEFPMMRHLYAKALAHSSGARSDAHINPALFAPISKITREPVQMYQGGHRAPWLVLGEDFAALLMPTRRGADHAPTYADYFAAWAPGDEQVAS